MDLPKLASIATARLLGRNTAGSGAITNSPLKLPNTAGRYRRGTAGPRRRDGDGHTESGGALTYEDTNGKIDLPNIRWWKWQARLAHARRWRCDADATPITTETALWFAVIAGDELIAGDVLALRIGGVVQQTPAGRAPGRSD